MVRFVARRLTYANVVATVALLLAIGGTATAATAWITGVDIKNGTVTGRDIAAGSVLGSDIAPGAITGSKVANRSLRAKDFAPGQLPRGKRGPRGTRGPTGPAGPAGSSDTAAQMLAKLLTVDGGGSSLDADTLDGLDSSAFARSNEVYSDSFVIDDPTGGDLLPGNEDIWVGDVNVDASCYDAYAGGGWDDRIRIDVHALGGAVYGVNGDGVAFSDFSDLVGDPVADSQLFDFGGGDGFVGSQDAWFTFMTSGGRVLNGLVRAETNAGGSDCRVTAMIVMG